MTRSGEISRLPVAGWRRGNAGLGRLRFLHAAFALVEMTASVQVALIAKLITSLAPTGSAEARVRARCFRLMKQTLTYIWEPASPHT